MSNNCLFCKIISGEIPSEKVYEDDFVIAFKDIAPLAKDHFLFIHKNHTVDINNLMEDSCEDLVDLFRAINKYTSNSGLSDFGYRIVTNKGKNAGQSVFHTHFHVLSGEKLGPFGA